MHMEPDLLNCRNCGAKLPPLPMGTRYVNCGFCHQGYDLGPASAPPVAPFGGVPVVSFGQVHLARGPSPGRYALYFGLPLLFIIVSVSISFFAQRNAQRRAEEL